MQGNTINICLKKFKELKNRKNLVILDKYSHLRLKADSNAKGAKG